MSESRATARVIEDDVETAAQLVDRLGAGGYDLDPAADGNCGFHESRAGTTR